MPTKIFAVVVVLAALAQNAVAAESANVALDNEVDRYLTETEPKADAVKWSKGFKFESGDGNFKTHIGGRVYLDAFAVSSSEFSVDDGVYFRTVRLAVKTLMYNRVEGKVQLDFSNGSDGVALKDVYLALLKVPGIGSLIGGHFKEPFSLQDLTSSRFVRTLERAAVVQAFAPARNMGIGFRNNVADKRLYYAMGIFKKTGDFNDGGVGGEGWNVTLRVAGLAFRNKDKKTLVHVGGSFSYRNTMSSQFRSRVDIGTGPRFLDTGAFDSDGEIRYGFEVAVVFRSVTFQAEWIATNVDAPASGDPSFSGWYTEIGWWITGETDNYKIANASFDRVSPGKGNFHDGEGGGGGAWQLIFRFETLDLNDGLIVGGVGDAYIVGVNWWLNPNVRLMFHVVYGDLSDGAPEGDGNLTVFEFRMQFDF